jgi:hypothetical protein
MTDGEVSSSFARSKSEKIRNRQRVQFNKSIGSSGAGSATNMVSGLNLFFIFDKGLIA